MWCVIDERGSYRVVEAASDEAGRELARSTRAHYCAGYGDPATAARKAAALNANRAALAPGGRRV